jgi:hypothetical protein
MNNSVVKAELYELEIELNRLTEQDRSREHPENLWDDLWTNTDQYNDGFQELNDGESIRGIYKFLENPIIPNPVVAFGWFDLLEKTEYPINNLEWIIFSKNILDVIRSLEIIPKLYPLRVLDRAQFRNVYSENVRKYENIEYSETLIYRDDWFYGVQLQPYQVLTDESELGVGHQKIEWRSDIKDPPAFFVDPKSPGRILITSQAREALEKAEIKGIRFTEPFGI